jgi:hypothetical protein
VHDFNTSLASWYEAEAWSLDCHNVCVVWFNMSGGNASSLYIERHTGVSSYVSEMNTCAMFANNLSATNLYGSSCSFDYADLVTSYSGIANCSTVNSSSAYISTTYTSTLLGANMIVTNNANIGTANLTQLNLVGVGYMSNGNISNLSSANISCGTLNTSFLNTSSFGTTTIICSSVNCSFVNTSHVSSHHASNISLDVFEIANISQLDSKLVNVSNANVSSLTTLSFSTLTSNVGLLGSSYANISIVNCCNVLTGNVSTIGITATLCDLGDISAVEVNTSTCNISQLNVSNVSSGNISCATLTGDLSANLAAGAAMTLSTVSGVTTITRDMLRFYEVIDNQAFATGSSGSGQILKVQTGISYSAGEVVMVTATWSSFRAVAGSTANFVLVFDDGSYKQVGKFDCRISTVNHVHHCSATFVYTFLAAASAPTWVLRPGLYGGDGNSKTTSFSKGMLCVLRLSK